MLILVLNEFPTFTITRLSITLLIFPECRGEVETFPTAKIQQIFHMKMKFAKKIQITPLVESEKESWNGNFSQLM